MVAQERVDGVIASDVASTDPSSLLSEVSYKSDEADNSSVVVLHLQGLSYLASWKVLGMHCKWHARFKLLHR